MTAFYRGVLAASFVCVLLGAPLNEARAQRPIDCMLVTQVPVSECQALFEIFFSLNGTEWVTNSGWLLAGNVCEWQGVDCNEQEWPRNVTGIVIHDNDLSGSIPESIALLPELRVLVLNNTVGGGYFNRIGGTLPSALGTLEHLEVLDLSRNSVGGTIPGEYGNLRNLRVLNLGENQFEGPIPARLYEATALEELNLSDNRLSGSVSPAIAGLTRLKHLDLSKNAFAGELPDVWDALPDLQSMQIGENRFSGNLPRSLVTHPSLFFFKASGNAFEGALAPDAARRLAQLNVCEIDNNTGGLCLPDTPLYEGGAVCNLPARTDCSFCANSTDVSRDECTALERLFYGTDGPSWTDRSGWFSTPDACAWFGIGCDENRIVQLVLPENNLKGGLPAAVAELPALASLDLTGNQLIGAVPLALATRAANGLSCALEGNAPGFCVPDTDAYRSLGVEPVCGLPLVTTCSALTSARLLSIDARVEEDEIVVTWEASAGFPGLRYIVEERAQGSFVPRGSVDARADQAASQTYEFRFAAQTGGVVTIRLRQRDPDGTESLSDEINLLVEIDQAIILLPPYPNPVSARAESAVGVRQTERVRVALYDLLGRRAAVLLDDVLDAGAVRYLTINAGGLADGTYVLRAESPSSTVSRIVTLRR
ncbi:MAG: leucine-rich repeat domain-containing protein [Rhodothermales bacterium]